MDTRSEKERQNGNVLAFLFLFQLWFDHGFLRTMPASRVRCRLNHDPLFYHSHLHLLTTAWNRDWEPIRATWEAYVKDGRRRLLKVKSANGPALSEPSRRPDDQHHHAALASLQLKSYAKRIGVRLDLRTLQQSFRHHTEELARRHSALELFQEMSAISESAVRAKFRLRNSDGLGSVRLIVDEDGDAVARFSSNEFGVEEDSSGTRTPLCQGGVRQFQGGV